MSVLKDKNILLGVTGSIAAYKACEIVRLLRKSGAGVQVVMTNSAKEMVGHTTFSALSGRDVLTDMFPQPPPPGEIHIHTAESVDCIVIAPATANVLAKVAQGIADDLLSTMLLANKAPILFAPAMHFQMWRNEATQTNLDTLKKHGKLIIEPEYGPLANLVSGEGRMAEPEAIVARIREVLGTAQDFDSVQVLITAGPTQEPIDPVRFISNRSSGKMGYALAQAALDRGAEVTLITGPVHLPPPDNCTVMPIETAEEMNEAVQKMAPSMDLIIMAAAVSDYTPATPKTSKWKKGEDAVILHLLPTPNILKNLRSQTDAVLVGFALETEAGEKNALEKLQDKNIDAIILNYANRPDSGFDADTNEGIFYLKGEKKGVTLPLETKSAMAQRILNLLYEKILSPKPIRVES
jgi:phosphopantothenoylcysteine decarboxylase/phosphopantothenate--cysteine ligase